MENKLKIKDLEIPHGLILAPMCGITLKPFRKICRENGAGLLFNQMVSAKALLMRDKKSFHIMDFDEAERPLGLQVFGNDPEILGEAAKIMAEKNPDIIDLNLGCPAKKIVNDGGGSALMSDFEKLTKIIKAMRKNIPGAFTIKLRAGWDAKSKNAIEVAKMAEGEGVDAVAIHGRTRTQGYSGKSDWDFIRHLKEEIKTIPVIGNGDVKVAADARRMMEETGCDGVMTGRGAFEMPWIFKNFVENSEIAPDGKERQAMILRQYHYAIDYHGMETGIKMMRKHLCAYTKGMRGGKEFRNEMVRIKDFSVIEEKISEFFQ